MTPWRARASRWTPAIRKRLVRVELPRRSTTRRPTSSSSASPPAIAPADVPLEVIRTLPSTLREAKGEVTVVTFQGRPLGVERGDTTAMAFGIAVDVGTTSVVTTLLELASGEVMASVSSLNPQATFGGDLMSRIAFAQWNPSNLRKLQSRIIGLLNQQIDELLERTGVLPQWVYKLTVVGNTCMHHVLLGIDPDLRRPLPLLGRPAAPAGAVAPGPSTSR